MLRTALIAALLLSPLPAFAQADAQAETGQPPKRVRSVTLTGDETCPKSTSDEVVVCSRISPNEQYRIPKEMRNLDEVPAERASWVNKARTVDEVSRVAGGLPDTCSPVGTGGQTGCALQMNRAFAEEKRAAERNDALVPGGGPQ